MLRIMLAFYQGLRNGEKVLLRLLVIFLALALIVTQAEQGNMASLFTGIAALAAVAGAFVAWWAIREQNRRARLMLSVEQTLRIREKYDSDVMKSTRKKAATFIRRVTTEDGELKRNFIVAAGTFDNDLIAVLNLFEDLGTLVRSDAIDKHFVWNTFFSDVHNYWLGAEEIVKYWREETGRPLDLADAEYLYNELKSYEREQLTRFHSEAGGLLSPLEEWQKVRDSLRRESEL